MNAITTAERYEQFVESLKRCSTDALSKSDDDMEYDILEEAVIGAQSFLHETSLSRLLAEELIDERIFKMSLDWRKKILAVPDEKYDARSIRHDDEWRQILEMSDRITALIKQHEQTNSLIKK